MTLPPDPFDPEVVTLPAGHRLFRVHSNNRVGNVFNPGHGGPSRFAFFGTPPVPALYAADTEIAAVCETLLHDVPLAGGNLLPHDYTATVLSPLRTTRSLRLASFLGTGLRRLGVDARDLTMTDAVDYPHTVRWAEAAHHTGFDGVAYMSARCNSDRAYVFFGDRVSETSFTVQPGGRAFAFGADRDWLIDFCAPLRVDVLIV